MNRPQLFPARLLLSSFTHNRPGRGPLIRILTLGILFSILMIPFGQVLAASFTVNSTADQVDANPGNGVCATSSGTCTLRAAIMEANASPGADTITIGAGVYALGIPTVNDDLDTTGDFDIHTPMTIVGVGADQTIIDGGFPLPGGDPTARGMDRLFEIHPTAGNVTFRDVTFREGYSVADGGGIQNWSPGFLLLERVKFLDNYAGGGGGGVNNADPAFYDWVTAPLNPPKSGRIEIRNSLFSGNAAASGAAVNNEAMGTVFILDGSEIVDNPGEMIPDPAQVIDPLDPEPIEYIPAPGVYEPRGGAIANEGATDTVGTLRIADSTVARNFATSNGAGILNDGTGILILERSTIDENSTEAAGGGLYTSGGKVTVTDSAITDNVAADGGGIYSEGSVDSLGLRPDFTITESTVTGNEAHASGGGMLAGGDGQVTVTDVTYSANKAHDAGGGLNIADRASAVVTRVTFTDNSTHNEGGGAWAGSQRLVTIQNSTFTGNHAGLPEPGAIFDPLSANIAGGGGLFGENGPLVVSNSTFTGNTATEEGGGISLDNHGDVAISDSTIQNNRAGHDGGGVENSGTIVTFERLLIQNNYATINGGGIHNSSSGLFTILDTTVQLNSGQSGGGLANAPDNDIIIRRSLFVRNTARQPALIEGEPAEDAGLGGGIYSLADGDSLYENTTISGNTAAVGGGGVFHDADGKLELVNLTIWRNSAPRGGGVGVVESDFVPPIPPTANVAVIARNTIIGGSLQGGSCDWYITSEGGNLDGLGQQAATLEMSDVLLPLNTQCFLATPPNSDPTAPNLRDRRSATFTLDALADNGGYTLTHALQWGSLAQDAGVGPCPETDQRGVTRPQNGACDIGAYEFEGDPLPFDDTPPDTEFPAQIAEQDTLETMLLRFAGSDNLTPNQDLQFECRLFVTELAEQVELLAPWDPIPPEFWWVGCSNPWQVPVLEAELGFYTFEVRAIDRADNIDPTPAVHIFTGDTQPPDTFIAEKPPLTTNSRSATFTFSAIDNISSPQFMEFECRLDSRDPELWLECFNPTFLSNLTTGEHTLEVRAYDSAENVDPTPARYTWTVAQGASCDLANITLTAVSDGWIDEVNQLENYLFETELSVRSEATGDPNAVPPEPVIGQNARALFRFPLTDDAPDCALESATLRLYNSSPTEGRMLQAVPISGPWSESTLTWFNQPGTMGSPVTIPSRLGYQEWDVTAHVQTMFESGVHYGWMIRDASESDLEVGGDQAFTSREMPQDPPEQTLPVLVLRYTADASPAPQPPTPATTPTTVHCGQVLTQSTLVANDLLGCMAEGLVVGAPNIVVDLGGHKITSGLVLTAGQEEGMFSGIRNGSYTNVIIRNGTVSGFGYGVTLGSGTTYNVVENLTLTNNVLAGAYLFDADNGRVGNTIRNNHFDHNGETGLSIMSDSENSLVENNTFIGNGMSIYLFQASGHRIEGNEISGVVLNPLFDSDAGIVLEEGSNHNVMINNDISDTGDAGIIIHMGSHDNRVEGGEMTRNGDAGVIIDDSDRIQVIGILAHGQSDSGVSLGNSHDSVVRDSDLRFNPSGVSASNTNNLLVENNDASYSLQSGFEIGNGLNIIVRDNVANNTGGSGISAEGGAFDALGNPVGGALFEGNITNENLGDGLTIASAGHIIRNNTAYNNFGFGILAGEALEPGALPGPDANIDGGGNVAAGNAEPEQCVGVVCTSGDAPASTPADLTSPNTTITGAPLNPTASTSATFSFTGSDNLIPATALTFECRLDPLPDPPVEPEPVDPEPPDPGAPPEIPEPPEGAGWVECISPVRYIGLEQGPHRFEVRARDLADNFDLTPAFFVWDVDLTAANEQQVGSDTIAPSTRIASGPLSPTTSTSATFHFSGSDNLTPGLSLLFECQIDGGGYSDCASPRTYIRAPGPHTFEVRAMDLAGNVDQTPVSYTWTIVEFIDNVAPDTTIDTGPDPVTTLTNATFGFSASETGVSFECSLNDSAFVDCDTPYALTGLAAGSYDLSVRAVDAAGNPDTSPATLSWTISSAPVPTTVWCGQVITQSIKLRNDLYDCLWDGLVIGANGITIDLDGHTIDGKGVAAGIRNDGYDFVSIKNGTVTDFDFGVMLNPGATNNIIEGMLLQANQEAGIGLGFVPHPIDPIMIYPEPPPPTFQSGVRDNILRNNTVLANDTGIWLIHGTRGTLISGNEVSANSKGGILLDRSSENRVEANLVNASSEPGVVLIGASDNEVLNNTLTENGGGIFLTLTDSLAGYQPSNNNLVEGNVITESGGPALELTGSGNGALSGNQLIDNVATFSNGEGLAMSYADNTLVKGNDLRGNKAGIELSSSNNNRIESNDTSNSEGDGISVAVLSDRNEVVGNISSNNIGAGISVSGEVAGDSGTLIEGNQTHNNNSYGIHVPKPSHIVKNNSANENGTWGIYVGDPSNGRFSIDGGGNRAQDNLGPIDPFSLQPLQCYNVLCTGGGAPPDPIPPDTLILQGPPHPSSSSSAAFHFSGSDNVGSVTFECRLDSDPFTPCVSPAVYFVSPAAHTFEVRAVDISGNVDPTPATHAWTAIFTEGAPETTILSGPDLTTVQTTATFTFSASVAGATFECALDGSAPAACSSPATYAGLAVGSHTFSVAASNSGGDTDSTPATYTWQIGAAPVAAQVGCGEIIIQSTRLLNDLIDCGGYGLIVGANNITIDLDGHLIDGVGLDAGILNNGYDSVTITNGTITQFDYGMLLNPGTSLNVIESIRFESNQEAGLLLSDADQNGMGNTIRNNTFAANSHGIWLASNTRFALIYNNAFGGNAGNGILGEFSSDNWIEANEISRSGGFGVQLMGGGNNVIVDNSLSNNGGAGIGIGEELLPSNNNVVQSNTISGGAGGILVADSLNNQILFNTVSGTTGPGVTLSLSHNNLVRGNDVRSNASGISLDESNDNRIEANNASATLGTGIEIGALSYRNTVMQNAANQNGGEGIAVEDFAAADQGNLIDRNTADGNGGDGISIFGVGHTVTGNTAQMNGGWAIYVAVSATDGGGNFAAGNMEPAQCFNIVCTIGTVPGSPQTWIVSGPVDIDPGTPGIQSNSRNASFTYLGSDNATPLIELVFECRLDTTNDLAWVDCEYPAEILNLSPGAHVFEIRAVDMQGAGLADPTPARFEWTYVPLPAGVAPVVTLDIVPENPSTLFEAVFTFHANEPDVTFECRVDFFGYEPCGFEGAMFMSQGAYEAAFEETEVGDHTFYVRAIDFEGNVSAPTTYTWSILGIVTTFTDGPGFAPGETPFDPPTGGPVMSTTATLDFIANVADATYECSLDLEPFLPCTPPVTYTGLISGEHMLRVVATDLATGASELEAAAFEWEIVEALDVTPPNTTLERAPANNSSSTIFEFTGVDDLTPPALLTFECRVDSANNLDWFACVSPFNLLDMFTYQDPQMVPGQHTFEVRAVDIAEPLDPNSLLEGNPDPTPATYTWTMVADTTPPGTGILSGPPVTIGIGAEILFEFFGTDNATPVLDITFECSVGTSPFQPCGSPTSVQGLLPGMHTFNVRAVDLAGNADPTPATRAFTIMAAPMTTITSGPSGRYIDGVQQSPSSLTESAIFVFSADQAGSTFQCSLDGADFLPCTSPYAVWIVLAGTHEFEVRATNPQGVVEEPPAAYEWLVELGPDITPPNTAITSMPTNPSPSEVATFSFTGSDNRTLAPNLTFECALDGTAYNSCVASQQFSDLTHGSHTMLIRAVDAAGNFDVTPASYTWVVELPPVTTILAGPEEFTENTSATFTFQSNVAGATFQCWLDGVIQHCTSPVSYTGLAAGDHLFAVLATAPAGTLELAWAEWEWTIGDTTPPITTLTAAPDLQTEVTSATFAFTANETNVTFTCSLDGAEPQACTSPVEYPFLWPGPHTFQVVAVNPPLIGSLGQPVGPFYEPIPTVYEWTIIDLVPPDTTITFGPAATTSSINAYFGFASDDPFATIECSLDGAGFSGCESPSVFENLAIGAHTLVARAVDLAGNVDATPVTYNWNILQAVPNTPVGTNVVVELPLPGGGIATVSFLEVTLAGATTLDVLNGAPPLPSGYSLGGGTFYDINTTAEGEPASLCISFDPQAFPETAVRLLHFDGSAWVDITTMSDPAGTVCGLPDSFSPFALASGSGLAPLASIISGPPAISTSGSATFTFWSDQPDTLILCSLDGLPFTVCTSPVTYNFLETGSHDFQVQAVGIDGQIQLVPSLYEWEVVLGPDTTPPDTVITRGSPALTVNYISIFEFSGSDDQTAAIELDFECSLDGAPFVSCETPEQIEVLVAGQHTLAVRAIDLALNVDATPAVWTWIIDDMSAPDTEITLGPASETTSTAAIFEFEGFETVSDLPVFEFECSLDNAEFTACTSPYEVSGLSAGAHVLLVRAKDLAGVVDPTPDFYEWLILGAAADTTPPDTFIVAGPPTDNSGPDVVFGFTASEPVEEFQCSLDGAPFEGCEAVYELIGLQQGLHVLLVRAVDLAQPTPNVDPTPASYTWTTLGEPDTFITNGPISPVASYSATFTFESSQASATFQCSVDGSLYVPCTSPFLAGPFVEEGTHQFEVQAVNQFVTLEGEQVVDLTPAVWEWEIQDITPPDTSITSVRFLGPLDLIEPNSWEFTFTGADNRTASFELEFECSLDGALFEGCTTPHYILLEELTGGVHELQVRAVDAMGNVDTTPASHFWSTEGEPETTILSGPALETDSTEATFTFSSDQAGATFECALDGATVFTACSSPVTFTDIPYGEHQLLVRAVTPLGTQYDLTPAEYSWASGYMTPPIITILSGPTATSGPEATSTATTAAFIFTSDNPAALFQCSLDGSPLAFCTSGIEYAGLLAGAHTFEVTATRPNLLVEAIPAVWEWTVIDETAPETMIVSGTAAEIALGTDAVFVFLSNEADATFQCSLNGSAFAECAAPPLNVAVFSGLVANTYTLEVRAVDPSLNVDATPESYNFTVIGEPVTTILTGPVAAPATTTETTAAFTFSADQPGSTFACALDGASFTPCASGVMYSSLEVGSHLFEVQATNSLGVIEAAPVSYEWIIVEPPPNTAAGTNVSVTIGSATVTFASVTAEGVTTVSIIASPPALPTGYLQVSAVYYDLSTTAEYTAPVTVCFSYDTGAIAEPVRLLHHDGTAWLDVTTSNDPVNGIVCGETASLSPFAIATAMTDGQSVTVPDTTIESGPPASTASTSADFAFSSNDPLATFECSLDDPLDWGSCTATTTFSGLTVGSHTLLVRAKNADGLYDATPAEYQWTVTPTPDTFIDSMPEDPTESTTATFIFSSDIAGVAFECALDDAPGFLPCESPLTYTGLALAEHDFQVRARDADGNVDLSPADHSWVIGDIPSPVTITSGPPASTSSTSATFAFSADEVNPAYECALDSGAYASCASPKTYNGLPVGVHTFNVRVLNPAAVAEAPIAVYAWEVVDLTAPDTVIDAGPAAVTGLPEASISFHSTEPSSTFECSLNGAPFAPCSSPVGYSGLLPGSYTAEVRALDASLNADPTPASRSWTYAPAPQISILTGPEVENSPDATFTFEADQPDATFECSLDASLFAACTSPKIYTGLGDGEHIFWVRAINALGIVNPAPDEWAWTIETTPPQTTIVSGPPATTSSTSATFNFASSEASTFACALDGVPFPEECFSAMILSNLAVGAHTFEVTATDEAGNVDPTPASYTWTVVDETPPDTAITSGPGASTSSTSATFTFSANESGSTFQCLLDGVIANSCISPVGYSGLSMGGHAFEVYAIDPAGNADPSPAAYSWTVVPPPDTVAPETTITSQPSNPSLGAVTFAFTATDAVSPSFALTYECRLNTGLWAACGSPASYTLTPGSYTFDVRATDQAGNTDQTPAAYSWTVAITDTTPPETTIDSGPNDSLNTSATFTFSSNEAGSAFSCALDGGPSAPCTSPVTYNGLSVGDHTFLVRATDPAGNADPSAATHEWRVLPPPTNTPVPPSPTPIPPSPTATPVPSCTATTITYQADADSWVDSGSTSQNKGTDSVLKVQAKSGNNIRALVRFALPTNLPPGCVVQSATLRMYSASWKNGRTLQALQVTGSWTENGVTWANQPATGGAAATTSSGSGYRQWTVTSQVQAIFNAGANYGFLIRDSNEGGSGNEQQFNSREQGSNRPQLVLSIGPGTVPSPTATTTPVPPSPTPTATSAGPSPTPTGTAIASCTGSTVTLSADADAWIDENSSSNNFGSDSIIKVQAKDGNNYRVLVRFALPSAPAGCVIQSATLRLYAPSSTAGRTLQALQVGGSWAEASVNWANQPATTGAAVTTSSGNGYREWNVTTIVQLMYSGSDNGFLIRDASESGGGAEQQFHSREKGSDMPQLVITFAPAP